VKLTGTNLRSLGTLFDGGTVTGLTDGQLLERFRTSGDAAAELAFAALVERHGPMVLGVCRKIVRDEHESEDVFQATFLVLATKRRSLWVKDSLGPWLHRVACRIAVRAKLASQRRREAEQQAACEDRGRPGFTEGADWGEILAQELERVPERYRAPVILCDLESRSYEDAARHLGCPVGTVKSRLARGRERLKQQLMRRGLAPTVILPGGLLSSATQPILPAALMRTTVRFAIDGSGFNALSARAVPASIAGLADGALRTLPLAPWKSASAIVLSVWLALGGLAAGMAMLEPQAPRQEKATSSVPTAKVQAATQAPKNQLTTYSWNRADRYEPPDFEAFFPDDLEGAKQLADLWLAKDRDQRPDAEILDKARRGLRRAERQVQWEVIRWVGGRYVWGKSPLNPLAVELMYHATDIPGDPENGSSLGHWARYFGISTLQPKTPAVLRTLADSCMQSDEPNNLSRVAWGVRDQEAEFLAFLKPYRESPDPGTGKKVDAVTRMVRGELNAFTWSQEKVIRRVREKFGNQLPEIKKKLLDGDSRERAATFELINQERIAFIMDASFLGPLSACANDKSASVRGHVANHLRLFIPDGQPVSPDVVSLSLRLARDSDTEVGRQAVIYGLAAVSDKTDDVIRAMLIQVSTHRELQALEAVKRSLGDDRERAAKILDELIGKGGEEQAQLARAIYHDMVGRSPDGEPRSDPATQAAYTKAIRELHDCLGSTYPNFQMKQIDWDKVGRELIPRAGQVRTEREFGLLVEEMVARLEDSHAVVQAGTAQPPAPDLPKWDPGLACLIDVRGRMVVYSVDRGSPAEKGGIRPGMTVVSLNGMPAEDAIVQCTNWLRKYIGYSSERALRYDAVRDCVRQQKRGSKVSIVLEDADGKKKTVETAALLPIRYLPRLPVPRKGINDSADLSWVMLENGIGYIYVRRITQRVEPGLDRAIEGLTAMKGLIIDVRGNSGGGFDTSTAFQNFDRSRGATADAKRPLYEGSIALLIDERTISAGEGWASWFIARKRARVFGTTTAGASSRKETHTLTNGLYSVLVPVKAYTGFLDRPIERRGIEPDVEVRCTARDLAHGRDTVVDTAAMWLVNATGK
jgi:RNA polymerase sigma factor (sigma-70 family)